MIAVGDADALPAGRRQSFRIFPGEGAEFTDGGVFFQDDFALAIREDLEGIALRSPEKCGNFLWDDDLVEVVPILRTIPVALYKNSSCFLHTFHNL